MTDQSDLRRNPTVYCDGKAREFTAVLLSAPDDTAPRWAAVAGQTCLDALDCVALTEDEAHAAGRAWAARRQIMIGSDPSKLYRVVPLPTGWGDLDAPAPAPVAMVAQPVQQAQACAVTFTVRNDNPNTIANRLAARLGRAPSDAELVAEVKRIMRGEPAPAPAMVPQPYQQQQAQAAATLPHPTYNTARFPIFVCQHGNWDIYANADGYCAAIPNRRGRAFGCYATHFGDAAYTSVTLGVDVRAALNGARA